MQELKQERNIIAQKVIGFGLKVKKQAKKNPVYSSSPTAYAIGYNLREFLSRYVN